MASKKKTRITLKQAVERGKLNEFIAEREDQSGDMDQFNACLTSMAGTRKEAPAASSREPSGDSSGS
ncbi:hypothetical protein [Fimbriiglobus ruber]|uniref:Uncharacterized protein n=1 Tax=Fimbriiglobus ruber TaxID=1908690 RepID=A0A225DGB4_9BACT|nr:hypothetical protein [Fimbriiglobus ruber]OWK35435.1 hypothetical protein FRUB_07998 [Fimbriiglobus ruber]